MPDRFHVGQRVRVVKIYHQRFAHLVGEIVTITEYRKQRKHGIFGNVYAYKTDARDRIGWFIPLEEQLAPLHDDRASFERFMLRVVEPRKVVSVKRKDNAEVK